MAGTSIDSAQSQSRRPSFMGSLEFPVSIYYMYIYIKVIRRYESWQMGERNFEVIFTQRTTQWRGVSLSLGPVKIIFVQDKRAGEDVAEQPGERCLAAGRAA